MSPGRKTFLARVDRWKRQPDRWDVEDGSKEIDKRDRDLLDAPELIKTAMAGLRGPCLPSR
ncbi:MAG TPA: hypothetical protein DCR97_09155 [Deltaproteobacteria bacterium]|nr:hypothetical protein [Deltaproteobacteria bacterium]